MNVRFLGPPCAGGPLCNKGANRQPPVGLQPPTGGGGARLPGTFQENQMFHSLGAAGGFEAPGIATAKSPKNAFYGPIPSDHMEPRP